MTRIIYLDEPSFLPKEAIDRLGTFGAFEVFRDKPDAATAKARLENCDVAIVEWTSLTRDMLASAPRLKAIVLVTTGYSFVDVEAAREFGIAVCNTPEYSRHSVAEHVVSVALALAKRLVSADRLGHAGGEYTDHTIGSALYGHTMGVVGYGNIGSWVGHLARGFGMKVLAHSRRDVAEPGVEQCSLDELLSRADYVALTASVNSSSLGILDQTRLGKMRPGAILVNIAGNGLVDEECIARMLADGRLSGAGFDDAVGDALRVAPNCILTPGIAWYTQDSLDRNVEMFVESARLAATGAPRFVVN
jgi:glycerate dehydrogenase